MMFIGNVRTAQTVELIKVVTKAGSGTKEDPVRYVDQYWDKEGNLIFVVDKKMLFRCFQ